MKKNLDNKGFSLIELIVSLAIITLVGGSIVSFIIAGSNSYASIINNTDIQEEAQLVMNQMSDIIIGADRAVYFNNDTNTLEIYNENEKYEISFDVSKRQMYLQKITRDLTTGGFGVSDSKALMAENVTGFQVDMDNVSTNGKMSIKIKFENKSKIYEKEETFTLRNRSTVKVSNNLSEIYPAS